MREHLYKAIRKDNHEWEEGLIYHDQRDKGGFPCCDVMMIRNDCDEDFEIVEESICQFIQEVNKHRIFENDIVKAYKHGDLETQPFIYPIEYRNGTYWFGNWTWLEFLNVMRFVEVIGSVKDLKR